MHGCVVMGCASSTRGYDVVVNHLNIVFGNGCTAKHKCGHMGWSGGHRHAGVGTSSD